MDAILVDDEKWMLEQFEDECRDIEEINIVGKFHDAASALEFVKENHIDTAFLDIEMPQMNGIELAQCLRKLDEHIAVIFVTASWSHTSAPAAKSGERYIMKPYTKEDIVKALRQA